MFQNFIPSPPNIAALMEGLPQQNLPVRLVKQYKGIELSQEVLIEVTPGCAVIEPSRLNYCSILGGKISLHSECFPKPLCASLTDFDYARGVILLSDFSFLDWKERQDERVQPKNPTYVRVHCQRRDCRAFLEDLSLHGIGLLLKQDHLDEIRAQPGHKVSLDFQLSQRYSFTHLRGVLRYFHKMGDALLKVGIQMFPTAGQSRLLQEYIYRRREEILDEVQQSALKLRAPRGVENLYF